ncbi:transcriptional activator [Paraburkholderia fungorum]|jgi:DNA-binding SARP family transcriptional activator|uniref:AAA family ATPase n=1 Tax=Paraburkholderia fungorum TaxID=134537 RepID=UPI000D04C970|nr:AAA family ATPase [Paraburkholderia fungorum]PRZ56818.1 transcriptional activator [Paraburkholderia fungorum]
MLVIESNPAGPAAVLPLLQRYRADSDELAVPHANRIALLGPMRIERGDTVLPLKYHKSRALLAWLVSQPGAAHSRDWLAELLWPGEEPGSGRRKLKRILFDVKAALGEECFEIHRDLLCLRPDALPWVDVHALSVAIGELPPDDRLVEAAAGAAPAQLEALSKTAALYRGEFLADIQIDDAGEFERWMDARRVAYRCAISRLRRFLTEGFAQQGEFTRAAAHARRLTVEEPWDESAWQLLIGLLMRAGRRTEAQAELEHCRAALDVPPHRDTLALVATPTRSVAPMFAEAAERRQITVVYCQLTVPRCDDPDSWAAALVAPRKRCEAILQAAGGYIVHAPGGGMFAYFGFPVTHEGTVRRAVTAALECRDSMRADGAAGTPDRGGVDIAFGIHTGLTLCAAHENQPDLGCRLTRIVGLLANSARAGEVLMSDATAELLPDCDFRAVRQVFVSDASTGERVEALLAMPLDAALPAQERGTLIGRDAQLTQLNHALRQCAQLSMRALLMTGDAGTGKSSLVRQFVKSRGIPAIELRCRPELATTFFHPFRRWLRDATVPNTARAQAAFAALGDAFSDQSNRLECASRQAEAIVNHLLGLLEETVPDGGLICLDDLQWADPGTLQLVSRLVETPLHRRLPILVGRDDFAAPWLSTTAIARIQLKPLSPESSLELITTLTQGAALEPDTEAQIARRADGVPLYLVALARAAADAERVPANTVPPCLHELLMGRIDSVGAAKPLAQLAAASGRDFSAALLADAAGRSVGEIEPVLTTLLQARLIVATGAGCYAFRHPMLREAAYQSLSRERRQWAHQRVAGARLALEGVPKSIQQP